MRLASVGAFFLSLSLLSSGVYANEHGSETAPAPLAVEENQDPNAHNIDVRDTPKDFKIPSAIWDRILDKEHKEEGDEPLIVWLPVKVFLSAKRSNILIDDKIQYNLPRGGGTIDQSKNIAGDRGTFYLKFGLSEFANPSAMKVFFISNSKKRRLDGDVYGSGCNVYFDVTSALLSAQKLEGLKYNVTDNRHVSALSGHFVFVQIEKDKVSLSQVEFTDTKNRDYLCKI